MAEVYFKSKKFLFESSYTRYIFLLFLLILFSRGFPLFNRVYAIAPIFFVIFFVFGIEAIYRSKYLRNITFLIVLFAVWAASSSIWSQFPVFTLKRSLYFLLVSLGSLFVGYQISKKNNDLILNSFLILNIIIIALSIFSLISNTPGNAWTGGHGLGFMGFTNHQNKLGQYIYITAAPLILFYQNPSLKKSSKFLIYSLVFINLVIIALSVSRAAILALFITWLLYSLLNFSLLKTIFITLIFIGVIFSTVFITSKFTDKHEVNIVKNENYLGQRREKTIFYSWQSALNGGLFGLGYGISDKRFKPVLLGYYDNTSEGKIFRREKTVSVLAIVEEVGLIGLALLLVILFYPIILLWQKLNLSNRKVSDQHPASSIQHLYF